MASHTPLAMLIATWAITATTPLWAADTPDASAAKPPLTYDAVSDTKYYPKPALPQLGPAGTIIKDPTFGCPVLRVTDEKTDNSDSLVTPAGSEQNPWNTDSTLFCVMSAGQRNIPFRFDPKTMTATRIKDLPYVPGIMGVAPFSYHDKDICWGKIAGRNAIVQYNFSTGKSEEILDVAKITGLEVKGMHAFTISANDMLCLTFGSESQDKDPYCLVYDPKTQTHHLYDTKAGKIDGKDVPGLGFLQHSSHINPSGRYVELFAGGGGGAQRGVVFWDIEKGAVYDMKNKASGHMVQGYGEVINQADTWYRREISAQGVTRPEPLTTHPPGERYFAYDGHISWNNTRPDLKPPVVLSTYHIEERGDPKMAWGDEILAIATDGSQKVWRFCHHRSIYHAPAKPGEKPTRPTNFWDCPRGNVSQDGLFYMFTSNWQESLGKDSRDRFRTDVFIVKLEQKKD
ncbi:MAG: hypothetical protein FWD61_00030 [Phycisphaerales bacterium]|nr:hypothetical protein [Phycisphaerales bacterium]